MTEQLNFWRSEFGEAYMERNAPTGEVISGLLKLWPQVLRTLQFNELESILEIGCNIGLNLRVLKSVANVTLYGVEPFEKALAQCIHDNVLTKENSFATSAFNLDMFRDNQIDLVFTSGVLIHIDPKDLKRATDNVVRIAKKYVVCIEYFSDKEEEVTYRGNRGVLFKRDFGAFYLDNYPNLQLRDYGFVWKRATGLDNLTWWLFEKK